MENNMKGRNIIAIVLVTIVVLLIVALIILVVNKQNGNNNVTKKENYTIQADGTKLNTSSEVSKAKNVEDLTIEESKIVYQGGVTKLTSKVTNNGETINDLEFNIKFISSNNTVIAEIAGLVGKIEKGTSGYITSSVTKDLVDVKDIVYEIKK